MFASLKKNDVHLTITIKNHPFVMIVNRNRKLNIIFLQKSEHRNCQLISVF